MRYFLVSLIFTAAGLAQAQTLPAPEKTAAFSESLGELSMPKFAGGQVIVRDFAGRAVRVYDSTGQLVRTLHLEIPGAQNIQPGDAAISPDGRIAVACGATDAGGKPTSFLVLFGPDGRITKIAETRPFGVHDIAFAKDGTLWGAGKESDQQYNRVPGSDVLRHYDRDGRLIGTALPSATLHSSVPRDNPLRSMFIASAGDLVVFYAPLRGDLVELALDGTIKSRLKVTGLPTGILPLSLVVTDGGDVYVSAQNNHPIGSLLYKLDRESSALVRVDTSAVAPKGSVVSLIGIDGDSMVFERGDSMLWVKPVS